MIIRCGKCESRFRFDDALMIGDGVWVRCSRCKEVFFQDNPDQEALASWPRENDLTGDQARPVKTDWPGLDEDTAVSEYSRQVDFNQDKESNLHRIMNEIREADAVGPGSLVKEFGDLGDLNSGENEPEVIDAWREPAVPEAKKKSHSGLKFIAYLSLLVFVMIFLGGLYLWIFPQSRQQVADSLSSYCPWAANIAGKGQAGQAWSQTALQDVRQHFVNNWLMGSLRVVEGSVINKGKYPLVRVQVRGRLYDNSGNIIGEWTSFGGNILTDAELATLTEEEIKNKLSQPLVGGVTTDRVNPNGQIPFMVVVAHHDQQAVAKTTVVVTGAEKLL